MEMSEKTVLPHWTKNRGKIFCSLLNLWCHPKTIIA